MNLVIVLLASYGGLHAMEAVDDAIGSGVISRALPHARREGVRLVRASYAGQNEASAATEREFRAFYRSQGRPVDDAALVESCHPQLVSGQEGS